MSITLFVKKLDFVKMSVVFDDGDNPFTHFLPPLYGQFFPLITTTIGHVGIKNEGFSPL